MNLRWSLVASLMFATACASTTPLERRYAGLREEQERMRAEARELEGRADPLFRDASALETQRGLAAATSVRCSAPGARHRTGANPVLGPLRLKQSSKSVPLAEGAPFEAGASRCSPCSGTPR
jgi:hypothetical protein